MKSSLAKVPRSVWVAIVVGVFGLGIVEKLPLWLSRLNDRDGYAGTALNYPAGALYGIGFAMFFGALGYVAIRGIAAAVDRFCPHRSGTQSKSSLMSRLALVGALTTVVGVALCTIASFLMEDSLFDISTTLLVILMISVVVSCIGAVTAAVGVLGLITSWIRTSMKNRTRA